MLDTTPPLPVDYVIIHPRTRVLLMAIRRALIMMLNALEDYLEVERSIKR